MNCAGADRATSVSNWVSYTVSMRVRPSRANRSPKRARAAAHGPGARTRTRLRVRDAGTLIECVVTWAPQAPGPAVAGPAGTAAIGTMTMGAGD